MPAVDQGQTQIGALRILSRRGGREILILYGEDEVERPGEKLAHISWLPSVDAAAEVARWCGAMLEAAKAPAGADGWHRWDAGHIETLVRQAKLRLTPDLRVEGLDVETEASASRRPWTRERVARLGFLVGLGWTAKRIAADPLIRSTPNNVYVHAHKFGLSLADGPQGQIAFRLPLSTMGVVDRLAARAGLRPDSFVRRWVIAAAADPAGSHFGSAA